MSDPDPDRDPAAQIRETITQSDHEELPVRSVIGRTTLSEREVVEAADSDDAFEFDHGIGLIRLVDTTANEQDAGTGCKPAGANSLDALAGNHEMVNRAVGQSEHEHADCEWGVLVGQRNLADSDSDDSDED